MQVAYCSFCCAAWTSTFARPKFYLGLSTLPLMRDSRKPDAKGLETDSTISGTCPIIFCGIKLREFTESIARDLRCDFGKTLLLSLKNRVWTCAPLIVDPVPQT